MRLHTIVSDLETARMAVDGGATVLQLRLKGIPTADVVAHGAPYQELSSDAGIAFVINDDLDAALALGADGVHLGQGDEGTERALAAGVLVGLSVRTAEQARAAQEVGAGYVGAGPVWATPTKPDAGDPIALDGLAAIARAVQIPVVAVGGIDASNAGECVAAGAAGVAVVRASADAAAVREAVDAALAAR